jgi:hypothetical protein
MSKKIRNHQTSDERFPILKINEPKDKKPQTAYKKIAHP